MQIALTSINPERNRYRFYEVDDLQPDFFSDYTIQIRWGRIGTKGNKKIKIFQDKEELSQEIAKLLKIREKHGYHYSKSFSP